METQQPRSSVIGLPGAIIIAGAIIAIAIIWVKKPATTVVPTDTANTAQAQKVTVNLSPITAEDHILGNPNATIRIVEYSDPSCGYCKIFNPILASVMDQYGPSGKVAWVYRSYPLDTPDANGNILHPNANHESQALECAASLGGNDKFWAFEKKIYGMTTSSASGLDQKLLPVMAKEIGLDITAFNACLSSGKFKSKVGADTLSGNNAGVNGTPTSFFVLNEPINAKTEKYISDALVQYRIPPEMLHAANENKMVVIGGALPKALVTGLIDALLEN